MPIWQVAQVAQNRQPQSGPKTFGLAAVGDVRCALTPIAEVAHESILVAQEPILVAPEPIVAQESRNKNGAPANLATKMEGTYDSMRQIYDRGQFVMPYDKRGIDPADVVRNRIENAKTRGLLRKD